MKKTILVVDDDPQTRESLLKVLRAEGYEVVPAENGQECIGIFRTVQFNLLLLDVSLPDMSGWEVFGTLTSINPFLPIIILTGKDEQHDLAVLGGAGALIEKPLDVPRLLEIVKEVLAESPEVYIQRLAGHRSDMRVVPSGRCDMNVKPTLFSEQTAVKRIKRTIAAIAGETVLAAGIALMALIVLVLLVFPGGVEVLAVEWGRAKCWMRKARNLLPNTEPRRRQEAVLVSPLVNYFRAMAAASLHNTIPSMQIEMSYQPETHP